MTPSNAPSRASASAVAAPLVELRAFVALWLARGPAMRLAFPADLRSLAGGLAGLALTAALLVGVAVMVDERAIRFARSMPRAVVEGFYLITALGASGYLFTLSAATAIGASMATARARTARLRAGWRVLAARAVYLFAVLAVSGLFSQIIKRLVGRARPKLMDTFGPFHFDGLSIQSTLASFPSGHTTTAFAAATALAFFLPRWQAPLLLLACAVGMSRVFVGAHYPSDVLAGVAVGTLVAVSLARAFARRDLVFHMVEGRLERRGEGLVRPALRSLFARTVK